jgi:RNA polymerase sigma factor (TIGR02999 family)
MSSLQNQVTTLIVDHDPSEDAVFDQLLPLVYDDLRRIAHRQLQRDRAGHTLCTTDLVHESYLNLVNRTRCSWNDRAHFFAVAARAMRHVLIDYARKRNAQKRGGKRHRVTLENRMVAVDEQTADLLALDEALNQLTKHDPRMVKVVECRFFGGMTIEETAEAVDTSARTVQRDWTRAKAYLHQMLNEPSSL